MCVPPSEWVHCRSSSTADTSTKSPALLIPPSHPPLSSSSSSLLFLKNPLSLPISVRSVMSECVYGRILGTATAGWTCAGFPSLHEWCWCFQIIRLLQVGTWSSEAAARTFVSLSIFPKWPASVSSPLLVRMLRCAPLCWGGVGGQQHGRCAGRHPHHPLHHHQSATTTTLPSRAGGSPHPRWWAKTLTPPWRSTTTASSPTTTMWLKVRGRQTRSGVFTRIHCGTQQA